MNWNGLFTITLACAAGFFGGLMAPQERVSASSLNVVRATRFELVNAEGTPVGSWEALPKGGIRLAFLPNLGTGSMEFGLLSDGRPHFQMSGRDGKKRVVIELTEFDKPILGMGDERWEGRLILGFNPPDTAAALWDEWGLMFRYPGSERPVAGIGMRKIKDDHVEGLLTVSGKRIR